MNKHTSAPWDISGQLIVGPSEPFPNPKAQHMGKVVAELRWNFDGDHNATEYRIDYQEMTKNASLIAASPDLLQSLRELLEICRWKCSPNDEVLLPSGKTNHQAMIEAMAAIAKAEGA